MVDPQPEAATGIIRTISHDFKEPLRSVRWYLEKLKSSSNLDEVYFSSLNDLDTIVEFTQGDFKRFYEDYRDKKIPLREFRSFIRNKLGNNMRYIDSIWRRIFPQIEKVQFTDPKITAFQSISVSNLDETIRRILRRYDALLRYMDVRDAPILRVLGIHNEIDKVMDDLQALISSENIEDFQYILSGSLTAKFDQTLVSLILQNLIVNSIKYRRRERSLRIEVQMAPVGIRHIADLLPAGPAGDSLRDRGGVVGAVVYSDNGKGIPAAFAESAFHPFVQVDPANVSGGAGIGLAVVRSAVERQDGTVWLRSRVGAGTTFFLLFPIEETIIIRQFSPSVVRSWFEVSGGIN